MTLNNRTLLGIAKSAINQGRYDEAATICQTALASSPNHGELRYALGVALLLKGQFGNAARQLQAAITLGWSNEESHINLAVALLNLRRYQDAAILTERAIELNPQSHRGYTMLGDVLLAVGDGLRAAGAFRKAHELKPDDADILLSLGSTLLKSDKAEQAEKYLAAYYDNHSDNPSVALSYARALGQNHKVQEMLQVLDKLSGQPEYQHPVEMALIKLSTDMQRYEGALEKLARLPAKWKESPEGIEQTVLSLSQLGRNQQALDMLETLRGKPGFSLFRLFWQAKTAPDSLNDADHQELAAMSENAPADQLIMLKYTRAWALGARRQFAEEIALLHQANQLERSLHSYDRDKIDREHDNPIQLFSQDFFDQVGNTHGNNEVAPIFVLGLPRAGTTTTESLLSARYPALARTGENAAIPVTLARLEKKFPGAQTSTISLDQISRPATELVQVFTSEYIQFVRETLGVSAEYFVDTVKSDYLYLPLLKAAFPRATFIQVVRDPLDTCFFCYQKQFKSDIGYANDLNDTGYFLSRFLQTVQHWRDNFPITVHTISYESMVSDPVATSKLLGKMAGLDESLAVSDEVFLQHPSIQGINTHWIGWAKNYQDHLTGLEAELERLGIPTLMEKALSYQYVE